MSDNSPKKRYSDKELTEFKELIEKKLAKATEKLEFYKTQSSNRNAKIKGLDDAVTSMESETTSVLAAREEKYLKHLKNALIRIENKSYGVCRESGNLIAKQRLMAVPHATLGIDAKKAQGRK